MKLEAADVRLGPLAINDALHYAPVLVSSNILVVFIVPSSEAAAAALFHNAVDFPPQSPIFGLLEEARFPVIESLSKLWPFLCSALQHLAVPEVLLDLARHYGAMFFTVL